MPWSWKADQICNSKDRLIGLLFHQADSPQWVMAAIKEKTPTFWYPQTFMISFFFH